MKNKVKIDWWHCEECGHEFKDKVNEVIVRNYCPRCATFSSAVRLSKEVRNER